MLKGKKIVLGVTGGIAVYKAVDLVSRLRKQGCEVRVVMTEHAQQFVTPLTFKEISGNAVATSMWNSNQEFNVEHIALANWADAFLVAPATANILAKMTYGIADDLLSTTLLAAQAPIVVCPAMNTGMYLNAATQENIAKLQSRGITVMPPASGHLACGISGPGRLPEPQQIVILKTRHAENAGKIEKGLQRLKSLEGAIAAKQFQAEQDTAWLDRANMFKTRLLAILPPVFRKEGEIFLNRFIMENLNEDYKEISIPGASRRPVPGANYMPGASSETRFSPQSQDFVLPAATAKIPR